MKRKCCHNAWLEQLWQNLFLSSFFFPCLYLERKGLILLNAIAWKMDASSLRERSRFCAGKVRSEVNLSNATEWHMQKHPFTSRLLCLSYIPENTLGCFLFNRTKSGGGHVKGREKKKRKECHRPRWLCIFLVSCLELSLQRGSLLIHLKTGADLY